MRNFAAASTLLMATLLLVACASKPCREPMPKSAQTAENPTPSAMAEILSSNSKSKPAPDAADPKKATERIRVAKPNGSRQCEGGGVSLERMERELGTIAVYSRSVQNDGLIRPQVCGAGTGTNNVYEIDIKDLPKAQSLGFRPWKK